MAIQGIGSTPLDGGLTLSFRQANVQANQLGQRATATKMYESLPHVSNTGSETRAGTSAFQRDNQEVTAQGIETMAEIMERDDDIMEVSNTGSESPFGASGFQAANDTSYNSQRQIAASAYNYFNI